MALPFATRALDVAQSALDWLRGRTPEASPMVGEVLAVPPPYQERDPAILGNRLTPARLAATIQARNEGRFQEWIDLGGEFLQKNPHLLTQLLTRTGSVVETRFEVRPGKGSNQQAARRAAAECESLFARWQQRQAHGWNDFVVEVTRAEWWGRSLHEIVWLQDGALVSPEFLVGINPRRLSYYCPRGEPEPWTLRLHDPDDFESPFFGPVGTPLTRFHPDKFLLHQPRPLGVGLTGEGLFSGVVWHLLMYEWSWRDLMALIELLGRPAHVGYYAAGGAKDATRGAGTKFDGERNASSEEITALRRAVSSVSSSLRAVLADTTRVEPLRYDNRATPLQREALEHLEALLSKAINGTTGVTDLVAGARAAHDTAFRQSLTFWRYDVRRVCACTNEIFARFLRANPDRFGATCPAPVLWSPDLEPVNPTAPAPTSGDGTAPANSAT